MSAHEGISGIIIAEGEVRQASLLRTALFAYRISIYNPLDGLPAKKSCSPNSLSTSKQITASYMSSSIPTPRSQAQFPTTNADKMPHHAHHHKHRVGGGEGGDSPDLNSAWWKAWVMALRTRAGGPSTMGKDKVLFYAASDTNRSIPASKYIPMATTNEFLFNEADALLPLDNPVYAPGHGGYCQALLRYRSPSPPID